MYVRIVPVENKGFIKNERKCGNDGTCCHHIQSRHIILKINYCPIVQMVERKTLALGHFVWVRILLGQFKEFIKMRGNVEMGIRYVMPTDKAVVDLCSF